MAYQSSFSIATGSGTTTSNSSSTSSATYNTVVEGSSPDNSDGLAASLGGEAVASGENTVALGSISAVIEDDGQIATVNGSATMVAASESSGDGLAVATADTFAAVSEGAGLSFTYNAEKESSTQSNAGSAAASSSTTTISAYELSLHDSGGSGSLQSPGGLEKVPSDITPDTDLAADPGSLELDGNFAALEFDAVAWGEDSVVLVDAFALTVEDELSIVAGFVDVAVD